MNNRAVPSAQGLKRLLSGIDGASQVISDVSEEFGAKGYDLELLWERADAFTREGAGWEERLSAVIKSAVELTSQEAPLWEQIAARFLWLRFSLETKEHTRQLGITGYYEKLCYMTSQGLYGSYLMERYSRDELEQCHEYLDEERNKLLGYAGMELLLSRYVIREHDHCPIESVQEMFLGIALHLAMEETSNRLYWVREFYDMLSLLKVTMATPTMANARKPYHQLSSCFIDTVPDSLDGIYKSIDNFAKVSKFGGGMGLYFGKVRASGSSIRGFEGAAGGVLRWIKLANDTAVAVDQLGVRQGAVAVYLDAWHKDLPEFLALRTNNGDDRMKAHDVFPAVCYPDLFWKTARENLDSDWYLMCPHQVLTVKGYALEDSFGEEWEQRYLDCVADERIIKRRIPVKELIRLIIKSAAETGTPFVFNRDTVNRANPNGHKGLIYSSNLCTEIAQNMSAMEHIRQEITTIDGDTVVVDIVRPGDFVVCNLASLSLGNINTDDSKELHRLVRNAVRAMDNVIDLNYFPLPYAEITSSRYRPIGLGVSGYHHLLAKKHITWESDAHLSLAGSLFEEINYAAILASADIAAKKGCYEYFPGSDWQTGEYFTKRGYTSTHWETLKKQVQETGLRNGYLLAPAPTSSTSVIAGTTAGLDPIMNRFFLEEKKNGLMPRIAPELSPENFWYYKNAYQIDQAWSIRAAGIRQRHIDQSQSVNLYITTDYTFRQVLDLYLLAWEKGVKTLYYVRSKSLEVEECETCSS